MDKSTKKVTPVHSITSYQMLQWATADGKSDPWSSVSSMAGFQKADITRNMDYRAQSQSVEATAGSFIGQKEA
ncbi:hypothetical protein F66182_7506 [Fusarium sp. NRRL 66182]|nr:hypothetical protein F66182_7506 [Fusarium sp. NRRL 66182]